MGRHSCEHTASHNDQADTKSSRQVAGALNFQIDLRTRIATSMYGSSLPRSWIYMGRRDPIRCNASIDIQLTDNRPQANN